MRRNLPVVYWALALTSMLAFTLGAAAQVNPNLYAGLKWRNVGPFHGGRIAAVSGAIGQPGVFYAGLPQGGIWKTTSAGVTWFPIFDQVKSVDSVGAVAVAPSDANIVYAGAGDPILGSLGNGMWKSTDAGKTWQHIGLEDTVKIDRILVDPKNPDLVIVSALGDAHRHGGGIWRSTDGGQTWKNVLKPAGYTGTREVEYEYDDPKVMLADTQGTENPFAALLHLPKPKHPAKPTLLFKSTNEGRTWKEVKIPPFPGRIAVAVAEHGRRIYIVGNAIEHGSGLFRSDDGGVHWQHMAGKDTRIQNGQGGYSSGVFVDPQNPDVLYTVSTAMYRSTDGGVTFHAFKGAPGGEDYHKMWIDPTNPRRMVVGTDQGASVTLDGGRTWSLWYTENVAQIYKVATTHQYPFWIVGSQQDTGAVMIKNRGNFGQVNVMDWNPVPSSEFGVLTTDPLHPQIIYGVGYGPGGGGGSELVKINMHTGQWENVSPRFGVNSKKYRASRDMAKEFDPFDPHALYVGYQCLMVTHNGGYSWQIFSPDLTTAKDKPQVPCGTPLPPSKKKAHSGNPFFGPSGPVLNGFSISPATPGVFWTVSSNGQIYNTVDGGKHWTNVSNITGAAAHTQFQDIIAGDVAGTAYVIGRVGGQRSFFGGGSPSKQDTDVPLIWRTTDGGQTWVSITAGLPRDQRTGSWVNVLRADPKQPGLLFVGTETTVYVSFDNGDHWQSLRQNLPSTSIRDLVVHTQYQQNDLVICTYGRGFWVLDDLTPLRQIAVHAQAIASSPAYLFPPEEAIRARINDNWDQPFSVEVPHAPNPPYGVIVDYYLAQKPDAPIQLQIFDAQGRLVRTITSTPPPPIEGQAYPRYWLASPQSRALPTQAGENRINWNLEYNDPPAFQHDLENQMNMVAHSVTPGPHGPQVIPGVYTLKLTVDGQVYTRHVTVRNDPRVGQSPDLMAALRAQNRVTMLAYYGMQQAYAGYDEVNAVKTQLASLLKNKPPADVAAQGKKLEAGLTQIGGRKPAGGILAFFLSRRPRKPNALQSFVALNNNYNTLVSMMQVGLDMPPTPTQVATAENDCRQYNRTVAAWKVMQTQQLASFNTVLANNHLPQLNLAPVALSDPSCGF
ncbi:MAG: WD40/YVTN/BNR-like repeat-containing protein [Terriglobales bacterium]